MNTAGRRMNTAGLTACGKPIPTPTTHILWRRFPRWLLVNGGMVNSRLPLLYPPGRHSGELLYADGVR
jgi:hypothetical protein